MSNHAARRASGICTSMSPAAQARPPLCSFTVAAQLDGSGACTWIAWRGGCTAWHRISLALGAARPRRSLARRDGGPACPGSLGFILRIGRNNLLPASSWLRRAGARRVLGTGEAASIAIPSPRRSREWLARSFVECTGCQSLVKRRSPTQRRCDDCRTVDRRECARLGMRRLRGRR
jgi:hypothetical protein